MNSEESNFRTKWSATYARSHFSVLCSYLIFVWVRLSLSTIQSHDNIQTTFVSSVLGSLFRNRVSHRFDLKGLESSGDVVPRVSAVMDSHAPKLSRPQQSLRAQWGCSRVKPQFIRLSELSSCCLTRHTRWSCFQ